MVTELCHVFISNGKFYHDSIACDVIDMDAYYILLRRLWKHDIDATHRDKKTSICSIGRAKELP